MPVITYAYKKGVKFTSVNLSPSVTKTTSKPSIGKTVYVGRSYACPACDYVAKSAAGLGSHGRQHKKTN